MYWQVGGPIEATGRLLIELYQGISSILYKTQFDALRDILLDNVNTITAPPKENDRNRVNLTATYEGKI